MTLTPITREELLIAKILGEDVPTVEAITRMELYLAKIGGQDVTLPEPVTRVDYYLAKIAGMDAALPEPITRVDHYLAKIAGLDVELPEPITREDHLLYEWAEGGVVPTEIVHVIGVPPLMLDDAAAGNLLSLTQTGKVEQSGTPTPTAPVDIVCNNGALKWGVLGKNLCNPDFYEGYGWYIGTNNTVSNAATNGTLVFPCKPNTTYSWWHTNGKGGARAFELTTDTITSGQTATWAVGNPAYSDAMTVRKHTTSADAKLLCILFARVDADNVGRTKDEQFADFMLVEGDIETATAYEPYKGVGLYTVGNPEVISVGGKNLNGGTLENKGYTSTGGESTSTTFAGTLWKIPTKSGEKFTVSWGGFPDGVSGVFINTWKTDGSWNTRQAISAGTSLTYTVGAGIGVINFTLYKTGGITIGDDAWIQVEYGTSATDYVPYREPQTVAVPNLFAVGDYADEVNLVSGIITRRVGVAVLDGTENWNYGGNSSGEGFYLSVPEAKLGEKPISTHFQQGATYGYGIADMSISRFSATSQSIVVRYDDCLSGASVALFKAFLAAQYAAGTPVIVLYPLAESVEESAAPQELPLAEGDSVITVTANVDGITLDAEYAKVVGA